MKISRIRHVVITSIIFLCIIAVIVLVYNSTLTAIRNNTQDVVYRVVATKDIEPGEEITSENVERVQIQNVIHADGMIYKLNQVDSHGQFVEEEKNNDTNTDESLWAIGKVAKDKIYKGEILLAKNIVLKQDVVSNDTRLYAIPFESATTGGYNITLGEVVDICVFFWYFSPKKSTWKIIR